MPGGTPSKEYCPCSSVRVERLSSISRTRAPCRLSPLSASATVPSTRPEVGPLSCAPAAGASMKAAARAIATAVVMMRIVLFICRRIHCKRRRRHRREVTCRRVAPAEKHGQKAARERLQAVGAGGPRRTIGVSTGTARGGTCTIAVS